jgi:hypothetical protein
MNSKGEKKNIVIIQFLVFGIICIAYFISMYIQVKNYLVIN